MAITSLTGIICVYAGVIGEIAIKDDDNWFVENLYINTANWNLGLLRSHSYNRFSFLKSVL